MLNERLKANKWETSLNTAFSAPGQDKRISPLHRRNLQKTLLTAQHTGNNVYMFYEMVKNLKELQLSNMIIAVYFMYLPLFPVLADMNV